MLRPAALVATCDQKQPTRHVLDVHHARILGYRYGGPTRDGCDIVHRSRVGSRWRTERFAAERRPALACVLPLAIDVAAWDQAVRPGELDVVGNRSQRIGARRNASRADGGERREIRTDVPAGIRFPRTND